MKRVFFDSKCPFCKKAVAKMKKKDTKHQFNFSSLDGKKAKTLFTGNYGFLRKKRSIVFLEGKRVWVKANALLRLYWLQGGPKKILGAFFVIPGFIINPIYHICTWVVW